MNKNKKLPEIPQSGGHFPVSRSTIPQSIEVKSAAYVSLGKSNSQSTAFTVYHPRQRMFDFAVKGRSQTKSVVFFPQSTAITPHSVRSYAETHQKNKVLIGQFPPRHAPAASAAATFARATRPCDTTGIPCVDSKGCNIPSANSPASQRLQ